MKAIEVTDEKFAIALKAYKDGAPIRASAKKAGIPDDRLRARLKSVGEFVPRAQRIRDKKSGGTVKDNALDLLTPDALYWIGFLYADGHIEKSRPRMELTLATVDKGHLMKYKSFFGDGLSIREVSKVGDVSTTGYISNGAFRVGFSSERIYERLKALGFTHNKTWTTEPPHELLVHSRDFWRGVIDGDGSISEGKDRWVNICGQDSTILSFLAFLNRNGVTTTTRPYKVKTRNFLWTAGLHHHTATKTATLLYKDATTYLDRKYEVYLSWQSEQNICIHTK